MTLDYALLHSPTDSLILPTKRRFFPFKIPNFHHQLRHYISTADPNTIYVVAHKVVHSIHTESQRWETVGRIPFEPKCLAAGYGWIVVGGSDNGECAFIRLTSQPSSAPLASSRPEEADVDTALPIDIDSSTRTLPAWATGEETPASESGGHRGVPDIFTKALGGSIVNSVTIHRLPADGDTFAQEDVAVFSNNDKTIKVFSLTQRKLVETIPHPACMNHAIVSPDSQVLAAVGDENVAYFYRITRDSTIVEYRERGERLSGWKWNLLRRIQLPLSTDLNVNPGFDDGSCFTVAFSPSSHLCAVGSQTGVISIWDMEMIRQSKDEKQESDPRLHVFRSSRPDTDAGAVRSMAFSPDPWDLLVWIEDTGRAGIADVRSAFIRRQILDLDKDEPGLQKVRTSYNSISGNSRSDDDDLGIRSGDDLSNIQQTVLELLDGTSLAGQSSGASDRLSSLRESLVQDLTERERQIIEFLNTARWSPRQAEGADEGLSRTTSHPRQGANVSSLGAADVPSQTSRTTSPFRSTVALHDLFRENYLNRINSTDRHLNQRRRDSIVVSQSNTEQSIQNPEEGDSAPTDVQLLLRWTASPLTIQPSESPSVANDDTGPDNYLETSDVGMDDHQLDPGRASALFDTSFPSASAISSESRQRSQRSRSIPRRSDRPSGTTDNRYDTQRVTATDSRPNVVAAERLRRQRLAANEIRSPRWVRHILNDLPDRHFGYSPRDLDPGGTAGVGWGADRRSLYIGTVEGIFEYQLNVQDRKTFPILSYR